MCGQEEAVAAEWRSGNQKPWFIRELKEAALRGRSHNSRVLGRQGSGVGGSLRQ